MRQIRHLLTMATLAVMGAMLAGCASEDNIIADPQQPADQTRTITLTTTVTLGDGNAATRALTGDGVKTFAPGDQIAVNYTHNFGIEITDVSDALTEADISSDGKTATFTVTLSKTPDDGCNVTYVYPAAMGEHWYRDQMIQNDQDGTLTTLARTFDYCEGTGTMGGTAPDFVLPTGVALKNQLTLAKFSVSDGTGDITSGVTQLMIEDGTHYYTVNRTAAAGPIWVAMYPIASTQKIKVTAVKGTDLYQSAEITDKTLAQNYYYDINVTTPQIEMSSIDADLKQPLTFEAKDGAAKVKFTLGSGVTNPVEYSTDDGTTWATYTSETEIKLASVGAKVMFRGNNAAYSDGLSDSRFSVTSGGCYVYGNVMSLVNAMAFPVVKTLTASYAFRYLFDGCSGIYSHDSRKIVLPATTLTDHCYSQMFNGCEKLTSAPALPATTLTVHCYSQMFNECSSLTSAPALPAMTLTEWCYYSMFNECSSLTSAPALPATTLAESCYRSMFSGCSNLTSAPALPATTLADYCYGSMFKSCSNLTTAPALPATTLTEGCYFQMFCYCSNLNYVKCLATDISADYCTLDWLKYVSGNGTFIISDVLDSSDPSPWSRSKDGIPSGWTVKRASEE